MDVYTSIQPVFQASRLLGFCPCRLVGKAGKRSFLSSFRIRLYSFLLVSGLLYFLSVNIQQDAITIFKYPKFATSIFLVNAFQRVWQVLISVGVIIIGCLLAGNWSRIYRGINSVDMSLAMTGITIPHKSMLLFSIVSVTVSICMNFGAMGIISYVMQVRKSKLQQGEILSKLFTESVTKQINNMLLLCFITTVLVLRQRFGIINGLLSSLAEDDTSPPNKIFFTRKMDASFMRLVQVLRRQHDHLCDLTQQVNAIFSLQLLVFTASSFFELTCYINNIAVSVKYLLKDGDNMSLTFTYTNSYFVLLILVHLFGVTWACSLTQNTANHTPILISKLLMKTCHPLVQEELNGFNSQLHFRRVQFTACEFFTIDASLLNAIVGGVATYVVILSQFNES